MTVRENTSGREQKSCGFLHVVPTSLNASMNPNIARHRRPIGLP